MVHIPKKLTKGQKLGLVLGGDTDRPYFEALGRFMNEFANVEALLYHFLLMELRLELKLAATVLSGARAAECIASIKRVFECRGKELPPEITGAFEHIGTLTTARNEIVHYGARGAGLFEKWVSTELKSHTAKKAKLWPVSADILTDMYWDAEKATFTLLWAMAPSLLETAVSKAARERAWQYKYPSNPKQSGKKPGQKGQPIGQAPKGPLKSSLAKPSAAQRRKAALGRAKKIGK